MALRTIAEASWLVRTRQLSPVELLRDCLDAIERRDPELNAFITVSAESALAEARVAEQAIQSGNWRGPLHGIPIGLKDLIDTAGVPTTAASGVFQDRVPMEDAEVVKKLKAAGAVLIGKQNLHEFAYGGSSLISHFGPVRNPVNPEFIAGGSSGGSAAAVATGMCYGAIGTDTAGSIREPAALCGVVGLKPSYRLVSTRGIIPLSESLDHAGPITRTVEDAAILLGAIAGGADGESGVADVRKDITNLVLGIPRNHFFENLQDEVARSVEAAIKVLAGAAKAVHEVDCAIDEDRTVFIYESRAYHHDKVELSPQLYDPETLRRLKTGDPVSDIEYQDALAKLQHARRSAREMFRGVDVLLTPTTPTPAPRVSDLFTDMTQLRPAEVRLLRNTRPANVWGLPAISIPCGTTSEGLPIGLQIIGPPGGETKVLRAGHFLEQSLAL